MIFQHNFVDVALIEAELKRHKSSYAKALETKNYELIKSLRRKIKLLTTRLYIVNDSITRSN